MIYSLLLILAGVVVFDLLFVFVVSDAKGLRFWRVFKSQFKEIAPMSVIITGFVLGLVLLGLGLDAAIKAIAQ